jgi:hypothetical protein
MVASRSVFVVPALVVLLAFAPISADDPPRQDGRLIKRLEWRSPHGELPGTYAEYLAKHPLRAAEFLDARSVGRAPAAISILIDATLMPSITAAIDQYVADITSEGHAAYTETVSGGTPEDIKAWVQARYAAGSEGVIFVGDITAAWAEVSGDVFPSDLFYMDLDGFWDDADDDGDYEIHLAGSGDEGPELYVARINAHTLDYDTEANMVNGYLAKAHSYRQHGLTQPWRGLEYVEEDWYTMDVHLDLVYEEDVARHDFGYFTTAADYLNQMDVGQHFVQPCVHSWSGGHSFGTRPTESAVYAHVYVNSPTARPAKLLLGSDDGVKAWLNGVNVTTQDLYQGWTADQFEIDVSLASGWNRLLLKISQGGGDYQFSARITDPTLTAYSDLRYQLSDPGTSGEEAPYIFGWLVNGFHQDSSENFWNFLATNYLGVDEASVNPEDGQSMGGHTWTTISSSSPYVDLTEHCGDSDYGVCYAFTNVLATSNESCELWMGYDDGARVWLNGQEVLLDNRYGGYTADMTKVAVNLHTGKNTLLVKVSDWMASHGFSARFAQPDGTAVPGLTYLPIPDPVTYIGSWLLNGPYANGDAASRLSQDYLGNETTVSPSEGDPAPLGTWQAATGDGYPFNLGAYYDHGESVLSQDIQDRDPPVLFYNLFACGPGRFTDTNYLAGAYIFNTTHGLITLASAKSGSMLNFHDFTAPLGEGKSIGASFHEWFDAQAPYELWEREWYYGMSLFGDPLLRTVVKGDLNRDGEIDIGDFSDFSDCFTGAGGGPVASGCGIGDFDEDDDVDCWDWDSFKDSWTGSPGEPPWFDQCEDTPLLTMTKDESGVELQWSALDNAVCYDAVHGDLGTLAGSGGDFTAATSACLENDITANVLGYSDEPAAGECYWILLRAEAAEGWRMPYDVEAASQSGERDDEINGSASCCP